MATIEVNKDAKLRFLRGLETNLPSTKTDGYVYVTTDTRAMYVDYKDKGSDETKRIRLGDVITVDDLTTLNTQYPPAKALDGILYYCVKENILCTPHGVGAGRKWQQINSQKTLETILAGKNPLTFTATGVTDGVDMSVTLTGSDNFTTTGTLGIVKGPNVNVSAVKKNLAEPDSPMQLKIGATDTVVTGTMGVSSTKNGVKIELTNATSGTDATGNALNASNSGGAFQIKGNAVTVSQADGVITIDGGLKSVTNAFTKDGVFTTSIKEADDTTTVTSSGITPKIFYGKNYGSSEVFAEGNAKLSVYTTAEVDAAIASKIKTAEAMTFKGTMADSGATYEKNAFPATPKLGDTIIIAKTDTYSYTKNAGDTEKTSQDCRQGDMFIAGPGQTGADGLLIQPCWTYVPAGNDELPFVITEGVDNGIAFKTKLGTDISKDALGTIIAGNGLSGSFSSNTLTIAHATMGEPEKKSGAAVTQESGKNAEYTAITGLIFDNGHVKGYTTSKLTTVDTKIDSVNLTTATATEGNGAKATLAISDGTNEYGGNITFKTSGSAANITLDSITNTITIDTVWGTF